MKTETIEKLIEDHIKVPKYIKRCADACRSDLFYGPKRSIITKEGITCFDGNVYGWDETPEDDIEAGDTITETYCGIVGDTLRDFIDSLPSELWVDTFAGQVLENEPEGFEDDETGEWIEPEYSDYMYLEKRDIVSALFGKTIADEFN